MSTGDEASRFARFAFRRHFFQHLGFRIARTVQETEEKIHLPVRLIKDPVYVLGVGEQGNLFYQGSSLHPGDGGKMLLYTVIFMEVYSNIHVCLSFCPAHHFCLITRVHLDIEYYNTQTPSYQRSCVGLFFCSLGSRSSSLMI